MDQETKQFFRKLCDGPGNKVCIDCDAAHPQWASISYGTYFCLNCSGVHRSLGVHLSFVRSISMDTWSEKQKAMMQAGGNEAFKKFAIAQQIDGMNIRDKYNTVAAEYYRNMIKAKVEGTPMPSLPPNGTGKNLTSGGSAQTKKPMASMGGGFGSGGAAASMSSSAGPRSSMASSGYGLSYQGGSGGNNPYQYNGAGNQGGGDLFSSAAGFFQGAVAAGNQFAAQASTKLNEAKAQAQNDGWFDFDNLQEQASAFANQAKQKAAELAGQEGSGFGNQNYAPQNQNNNFQGFGNNNSSNSLQPGAGQQARPSMSSVTASPAPSVHSSSRAQSLSSAPATINSASQQASIASKPIMFRSNSPPRVDTKQAHMSLTPPDLSKSANKNDSEKKSDLWDSDAWFDEM